MGPNAQYFRPECVAFNRRSTVTADVRWQQMEDRKAFVLAVFYRSEFVLTRRDC